jgi:hypothetical protein
VLLPEDVADPAARDDFEAAAALPDAERDFWNNVVKVVNFVSMSSWSSGLSDGVSFGRPEFKPWPRQISSVINGFVETHTLFHSMHWCHNWAGRLLVR